jgi:hypothetical protein
MQDRSRPSSVCVLGPEVWGGGVTGHARMDLERPKFCILPCFKNIPAITQGRMGDIN